jgi:predicted amidohydrolase YtcJ
VNQVALDIAGIDADTLDPPGGVIVRDANGSPTGMLIDTARSILENQLPPFTRAEELRQFEIARDECLRYGVTTFHDMMANAKELELFQTLNDQGQLLPRLVCYLHAQVESLMDAFYAKGPIIDPSGYLTVRGVKLFADGALGSRGALLMEDYSNDPGNRGIEVLDVEEMIGYGLKAVRNGFQLSTHALGDRAALNTLNVCEQIRRQIQQEGGAIDDLRFRMEHAEILRPEDVGRFADLGMIAAVQATHHTSDMLFLEGHLGRTRVNERASRWRDLLDSGAVLCGGSDTPMESTDPLVGIYVSETRRRLDGYPEDGWGIDQAMTREEAVRSYTTAAAYAAFEEDEKGSLEVGKLADAVLLSKDVMSIPAPELLDTHVLFTMIGGEIVYQT